MVKKIKGADLSTLSEVEACGGVFYDGDSAGDAVDILKKYGINMVRLRLWNDPYSEDGEPYGAGACDFHVLSALAKRMKNAGLDWLLCIHYSDFWADPEKQRLPKAWRGLGEEELEKAVYDFTFQTMEKLGAMGALPSMVAVGNELTHGLMWPFGKTPQFNNIVRFINAGIRAVKEAAPETEIMIHLDAGGNNAMYRDWFDNYLKEGGMDFDIIGMSFYPFWHGTLADLRENMNDMAVRYGKDIAVAETSTAFTFEDYGEYEKLAPENRKGMAAKETMKDRLDYPATPEGQAGFIREVMESIDQVPDGHGRGFFYWEPAWIPVPGSGWAEKPGWEYAEEKGPSGNEWANQALFDYEGRALPALSTIGGFEWTNN